MKFEGMGWSSDRDKAGRGMAYTVFYQRDVGS